jgi:hypothetical protein
LVWAEHLPQRWRVVILAVSPIMRLNENAVLDLEAAVARVESEGRKLILCGVSSNQYKVLEQQGLIDRIGAENVCVDLEFAIARGIDLSREAEVAGTVRVP